MALPANIQNNYNDELFNLFYHYKDAQLLTLIIDDEVDFIGNISSNQKEIIQNALKNNKYFEMNNDIYKIDLLDYVYLYKKFQNTDKLILLGVIADKTDENRLTLIDQQVQHLIQKSENW